MLAMTACCAGDKLAEGSVTIAPLGEIEDAATSASHLTQRRSKGQRNLYTPPLPCLGVAANGDVVGALKGEETPVLRLDREKNDCTCTELVSPWENRDRIHLLSRARDLPCMSLRSALAIFDPSYVGHQTFWEG